MTCLNIKNIESTQILGFKLRNDKKSFALHNCLTFISLFLVIICYFYSSVLFLCIPPVSETILFVIFL